MSGEDLELRDLLIKTLELNGSLNQMKAHLRANVFKALDEDIKNNEENPSAINKRLKSTLAVPEGRQMFCIVREFLEYFNLGFTQSVFEPETQSGSDRYTYEGREKIADDLGLDVKEEEGPVLLYLLRNLSKKQQTQHRKTGEQQTDENKQLAELQRLILTNNQQKEISENNEGPRNETNNV